MSDPLVPPITRQFTSTKHKGTEHAITLHIPLTTLDYDVLLSVL